MTALSPVERLARARAAQQSWASLPASARIHVLVQLRRAIAANRERIVDAIVSDTGKPRLDALAGDVLVTLEQMSRALAQYGQIGRTGQIVSLTLIRELGPVLTAIMVAGRNSTGIASELGSMKVTEQIDAMRALGTDPVQKLVTPRLIATAVMLPLLTIIADFVGMFGGFIIARFLLGLLSSQYWISVWKDLDWYLDITQGLVKPFVFAFVVSLVGCYFGLRTTGGTQGVGRSTTQAMVVATVLIFVIDLLLTKLFIGTGGA